MDFCIKNIRKAHASSNEALMNRQGVWSGSFVDWSDEATAVGIQPYEHAALQKKHGTKNVNLSRAALVKKAMADGLSQAQITRLAKPMGRGFGERMIKADHAALSAAIKKSKKKVQ